VAFTVAVNTKNLGKDVTYWIDIRSFNQNHIRLASYLTKGKLLYIGGDYNAVITTDKTGVARISHNVNADFINFANLGGASKTDESTTSASTHTPSSKTSDEDSIVMNTTPLTPPVQEMVPVGVGVGASTSEDDLPF
jgi:single-strand DNA-binding protein